MVINPLGAIQSSGKILRPLIRHRNINRIVNKMITIKILIRATLKSIKFNNGIVIPKSTKKLFSKQKLFLV